MFHGMDHPPIVPKKISMTFQWLCCFKKNASYGVLVGEMSVNNY